MVEVQFNLIYLFSGKLVTFSMLLLEQRIYLGPTAVALNLLQFKDLQDLY